MDIENVKIPLLKENKIQVRKEVILFFGILILGILLRLALLGRWSLWTDEFYTLRMVNVPSTLAAGVPQDQNPPFYDLLMRAWVDFGNCQTEFCLRLPSAIAGVLAIPVMWMIGMALGGTRIAFLGSFLLAASPFHIWYSREARPYSIAALAAICSIYFYLQVFRKGHWAYALGLAITTLWGLYTSYSVLMVWFLELGLVFLLWQGFGKEIRKLVLWLIAQLGILLGTLPWVPFLKQQLSRPFTFRWPLPFLSFLQPSISATLEQVFVVGLLVGVVLILLMIAASVIFIAKPRLPFWFSRFKTPAAWFVVLLLAALTILGAMPRGLSVRRQLLVLWPIVILFGVWGLSALKKRSLNVMIFILAFGLSIYTVVSPAYQDWRGVVGFLEENVEPGGDVLLSPNWSIFAFDYYSDGSLNYDGIKSGSLTGDSGSFSLGKTVWLVLEKHPSLEDYTREVEGWFEDHAEVIDSHHFSRYLEVIQYQIQP